MTSSQLLIRLLTVFAVSAIAVEALCAVKNLCPNKNTLANPNFCTATFPNPAVDCVAAAKQTDVPKCLKTCSRCCDDPNYNCDDKPAPTTLCAASKCAVLPDLMTAECAATCGFCVHAQDPTACFDESPACITDLADLCTDPTYGPEVQKRCPVTCGTCAAAAQTTDSSVASTLTTAAPTGAASTVTPIVKCVDNSPNCGAWAAAGFCYSPNYTQAQKQMFCARTCALCNCDDAHPNCKAWAKNGFCTSPDYTLAQKKAFCKLTCDLCSA